MFVKPHSSWSERSSGRRGTAALFCSVRTQPFKSQILHSSTCSAAPCLHPVTSHRKPHVDAPRSLCPLDNGGPTTVCTWLCDLSRWHQEDKSSPVDRWSRWRGAIHRSLDSSTFSRWSNGGNAERRGGRMELEERRGHRGHTHCHSSCLLMSLKPEISGRKHITMHACRLQDWFTNELVQDVAEDSRIFIRKKRKSTSRGQIPAERWNIVKTGADKNTNKEPLVEKDMTQ